MTVADSEVGEPARSTGTATRRAARRLRWWRRPEVLFLPAFLIVGAIFIAWVPPGWNADEPAHTYRAAQLAHGQLLATVNHNADGSTSVGGELPKDIPALFNLTGALGPDVLDPSAKIQNLYTPAQERAAHPSGLGFADFRNTALYSPIAYAPDVVAFWAGDAAGWQPASIVTLARVLSLLTVAAAWWAAILITPRAKWVFAAVGLLPSVVSQSAALSADGMLFAVTAVFVAVWGSSLIRTSPPSRRSYAALIALSVLLCLCKIAYAPLVLLVVAVPWVHRSGSRLRAGATSVLMLLVAWAPAVAWSILTRAANVALNATADVHAQMSWIEGHPLGFAQVIYKSFLGRPSDGLALSVFGNFIWLSAGVPALYALFGAAGVATSRFVADPRESAALGSRTSAAVGLWSLAVVAVTSLVICLGIYLTFAPVGSDVIDGLTGRYFISPLLVALVAFNGSRLTDQTAARWTVVATSTALAVGAVLTMHHRLYG